MSGSRSIQTWIDPNNVCQVTPEKIEKMIHHYLVVYVSIFLRVCYMVIVELRSYTNDIYSSFLMIRAHDINVSNISTCIPKMNPLLLIHLKKKRNVKGKTRYVIRLDESKIPPYQAHATGRNWTGTHRETLGP
jgi:hypothetical protein